jgi:hypothetical protein
VFSCADKPENHLIRCMLFFGFISSMGMSAYAFKVSEITVAIFLFIFSFIAILLIRGTPKSNTI